MRRWLAVALLANLAAQPILPIAMAALLLAHAGEHAHSISLSEDAGHFDLVLSHDGAEPHEHSPHEPPHAPHASSGGDHVVHLSNESDSWQTRRLAGDEAPVLPVSIALAAPPVVLERASEVTASPPRDSRGSRTVVLLL